MKGEIEKIIEENRKEYAAYYPELRFVTPEEAYKASVEREELIEFFKSHAKWDFNRTKVDTTRLSPGCQSCGEGTWSCLFINNTCNANCFYCPAAQEDVSQPTTQTVPFNDVESYIAYIRKFNFKGVSISGGEPFLTYEKTLHFLRRIREEFGKGLYLWLYTNGILATRDKFRELKDAGLDEIRFDIGAVGYQTDKVEVACDIFDTVTVEIPAVPEEEERLKALIPKLVRMGVTFLNLHQIRCTSHNFKKLVKKGYTFLHGPKISVLESELTALRLIKYVKENQYDLPINYCSFIYKYRFQRLAARKRFAPYITDSYEDITETGMIRRMMIQGSVEDIKAQVDLFRRKEISAENYHVTGKYDHQIYVKASLWNLIDFNHFELHVSYSRAFILPGVSYQNRFVEIPLRSGKQVVVERIPYLESGPLSSLQLKVFEEFFLKDDQSKKDYRHVDTLFSSWQEKCQVSDHLKFLMDAYDCEKLRWGLMDYY